MNDEAWKHQGQPFNSTLNPIAAALTLKAKQRPSYLVLGEDTEGVRALCIPGERKRQPSTSSSLFWMMMMMMTTPMAMTNEGSHAKRGGGGGRYTSWRINRRWYIRTCRCLDIRYKHRHAPWSCSRGHAHSESTVAICLMLLIFPHSPLILSAFITSVWTADFGAYPTSQVISKGFRLVPTCCLFALNSRAEPVKKRNMALQLIQLFQDGGNRYVTPIHRNPEP